MIFPMCCSQSFKNRNHSLFLLSWEIFLGATLIDFLFLLYDWYISSSFLLLFCFSTFCSSLENYPGIRPFFLHARIYLICFQVKSVFPVLSVTCSSVKRFILSVVAKVRASFFPKRLMISVPVLSRFTVLSKCSLIRNPILAASCSTLYIKLCFGTILLKLNSLLVGLIILLVCSWLSFSLILAIVPIVSCLLSQIVSSVNWCASWFCYIERRPKKPLWLQIEFAVVLAKPNLFLIKIQIGLCSWSQIDLERKVVCNLYSILGSKTLLFR